MRSFAAALVVLALVTPWACRASSAGRELQQSIDPSVFTNLIGGSGSGSGLGNIGSLTSAFGNLGGSGGGGLESLASNIGGGGSGNPLSAITSGGGLSSITSAIAGGRKMLEKQPTQQA